MSRSIKNRNILNITTPARIRGFSDWEYGWIDGGDGFLYKRRVYDESPRGQWRARKYWQRERLPYHVTHNTPKDWRKLDQKTHRMQAREEIRRFMVGIDEDIVTSKLLKQQPWTW